MKKRFVINLLDDSESNSEEEEEEEEGDGYASAVSQMSDSNSKSIQLLDTSDEEEEEDDDDEDKDPTNGMNSRKISRMKQLTLKDKWANVLSPSSSEEEDEEEDESVVDDSNHDMLEIASVASEIKNPFSMAIAPPSPSKPSHLDLSFSESDDSYAAGTRSRSSSTSPSYPTKSSHTVTESEEQSPAVLPELPESPMKLVQDEQEQEEGTVWCRNSKNGSFRLNGSCTISGNDVWPNMELNPKFYQNLYPHQRIGIQWLASMHCKRVGGILGDDMGLGKVRSKLLLLSVYMCFSIALSTHYITLLFCCVCWYSHHIIIDYANFGFDFWINEYRYH
jgi:SNF2 family DNA or RNA helicase